jgi:hypothetical protein
VITSNNRIASVIVVLEKFIAIGATPQNSVAPRWDPRTGLQDPLQGEKAQRENVLTLCGSSEDAAGKNEREILNKPVSVIGVFHVRLSRVELVRWFEENMSYLCEYHPSCQPCIGSIKPSVKP